ncbi:MAG: MFS transporter [Kiritimatiellia bacterium]|nr:MFS transporter [Kiritimatiellia bacterium]
MLTTIQQKKSFLWIYLFSGFTSIFAVLTVFGSLLPLFCDALRMSKTKIGIILSILPLSYLVTIFVSRWVAQQGPKKILLRFYFVRYWFIILLPLAAVAAKQFNDQAAFAWVALMIFFFAVLRSIAETGWWPWLLELIPARARGKVDAFSSIAANIGAVMASLGAVLIMKNWPGLLGFHIAIYIGVVFGYIGLYMGWHLPGGEPQVVEKKNWVLVDEFRSALGDDRFRIWLKGMLLISMAHTVFAFLPLYLSERIGFAADKIMLFSLCFQAGVLASAFFWGWSADRFGSKPVFMSAFMGLCLIPVSLFLLPRIEQQSLLMTGAVYALLGIAFQGYLAGTNRYFFVTVLPSAHNPLFCSSVNLTVQSVMAAACSFFYGWLLDALQPVKYNWHFIYIDNFTVLFVLMLICYIGLIRVFRKAPEDSGVRTGQFMSFFFEGNPLLAFSSIFRYHLAEDEYKRMELTRRMGDAKSHLTVEELLQAVDDPNFNVRYEAIVSMARMPPDAKLIEALSAAVKTREPGLSEAAVWALGRMGDNRAIPVLREMLKCEYALLRSQCSRALAKLNDQASVPGIIAAFKSEKNDNICAGYAAALGRLRRKEILPDFLALLRRLADDHLRGEVILAIVRIIGGEHHFVGLWRRSRSDFETACAEELMEIEKKITHSSLGTGEYRKIIAGCARNFEQRNLAAGADTVRNMIGLLPPTGIDPSVRDILLECDELIAKHGGGRGDYILLALNALHIAVVSMIHAERKKRLSS